MRINLDGRIKVGSEFLIYISCLYFSRFNLKMCDLCLVDCNHGGSGSGGPWEDLSVDQWALQSWNSWERPARAQQEEGVSDGSGADALALLRDYSGSPTGACQSMLNSVLNKLIVRNGYEEIL